MAAHSTGRRSVAGAQYEASILSSYAYIISDCVPVTIPASIRTSNASLLQSDTPLIRHLTSALHFPRIFFFAKKQIQS